MLAPVSTGITVEHHIDGDGPPVVLLGGPHTCELIRSFIGPLLTAAGLSVITAEYRGVPPTDVPQPPYTVADLAEDAAGLVDRLGVAPCLGFGYSLGAFVVQEMAIRRPGLFSRMVLAGTRTEPTVVYRHMHTEQLDRLSGGGTIPDRSQALLRALLMFAPRRLGSDPFMDTVTTMMNRPPVAGYSELGLAYASAHYEVDTARLATVTVPTLVIGFQDDVLTPPRQGRAVAAALPAGTYKEIRHAGHGAFIEKPRELARLAVGFLT